MIPIAHGGIWNGTLALYNTAPAIEQATERGFGVAIKVGAPDRDRPYAFFATNTPSGWGDPGGMNLRLFSRILNAVIVSPLAILIVPQPDDRASIFQTIRGLDLPHIHVIAGGDQVEITPTGLAYLKHGASAGAVATALQIVPDPRVIVWQSGEVAGGDRRNAWSAWYAYQSAAGIVTDDPIDCALAAQSLAAAG